MDDRRITTKLAFKECGGLFHNNADASAIANRLVEKEIVNVTPHRQTRRTFSGGATCPVQDSSWRCSD